MRTIKNTLIVATAALTALSSAGLCAPGKTPPGSFLRYRVSRTSELVQQVRNDRIAGLRYRNFFHTDRDTLVDVFKGFRRIPLPETRKLRVYFYDVRGRVVSEVRTVRKGTPVFVDIKGKPILEERCGNPLATILPREKVSEARPIPPPISSFTIEPEVFPATPEMPEFPPSETYFADLMIPGQPEDVAPMLPEVFIRHASSRFIPIFWWPHFGGQPPVPEPASMVLSGLGLLVLGAYRRITRSR